MTDVAAQLEKRDGELRQALVQAMAERDAVAERITTLRVAISENQNTMQMLRQETPPVDSDTVA